MRPFDNAVLEHKTTWTDSELLEEIEMLAAAIQALDVMGDRYSLVVGDLRQIKATRDSMAVARKL